MSVIQNELFRMQDLGYKEFNSKLIPTVDKDTVIGVRTPELRAFAKRIANTQEAAEFLTALPHKYYEENNLHAFLIEQINDYDTVINETERFLPYIDNWATCDSFMPKIFRKNKDRLIEKIKKWIKTDKTYTVRYAEGLLMGLYLDEDFNEEYPKILAEIHSEEYYVNMMTAWYFATALAKRYDEIIPFFTERRLDTWVHNKAIQKAVESNRISGETKKYLKTLKIKNDKK